MQLARIEAKYAHIAVTAALADGTPAVPAGVDVALLPIYGRPIPDTAWTRATWADGEAVVLLAGPDTDPTGALVVPTPGADLWIRVTDVPEVVAARVDRITVA